MGAAILKNNPEIRSEDSTPFREIPRGIPRFVLAERRFARNSAVSAEKLPFRTQPKYSPSSPNPSLKNDSAVWKLDEDSSKLPAISRPQHSAHPWPKSGITPTLTCQSVQLASLTPLQSPPRDHGLSSLRPVTWLHARRPARPVAYNWAYNCRYELHAPRGTLVRPDIGGPLPIMVSATVQCIRYCFRCFPSFSP